LWALAYILIFEAVSAIVYGTYIFHNYIEGSLNLDEITVNANNSAFALTVISSVICFWVFILVGKVRKEPLENTIKIGKIDRDILCSAIFLALGCRILVTVYAVWAQNTSPLADSIKKAELISPQIGGIGDVVIALFAVMVIAPVFEEIMCRGLIMGELMKIMRPWVAIALQALLFGAVHGVLFQSSFAVAVGIVLGILYYKTKSIVPSVVCHTVFNASVIIGVFEPGKVMCVIYIIVGLVICSLSMISLFSETDDSE